MKVLGLDFGTKRVGYAVGDTETGIAFGREVIPNDENLLGALRNVCSKEKVEYVVIGLPKSLEGDSDNIEFEVREFGEKLYDMIALPVDFEDERLSSKVSKDILKSQNIKGKDQKGKVDVLAAQRILQQWMDRREV
jgi:putative Holliday junction resolvase